MENAPALNQAEMLAQLNEMSNSADTGIKKTKARPRLKINQEDHDLEHGIGSFVIGVRKDEDFNIVDHGKKIVKVVVLKRQFAYSLCNMKNKKENCMSPLFTDWTETVKGINHLYTCGKTCPFRAKDRENRCAGQIVLFCIAFTEEGEKIPCIWYVKGSGYMPVNEFLTNNANFTYDTPDGPMMLSQHLCYINLDTKIEKNGPKKYYVPVLSRGGVVGMDKNGKIFDFPLIQEMNSGLKEVNQGIAEYNAQLWDKINQQTGCKQPSKNAKPINQKLPEIDMNDGVTGDSDIDNDLEAELLSRIED